MNRLRKALKQLMAADSGLQRVTVAWFLSNLAEWAYITALSIHEYRLHGPVALGLIGARFASGALLGPLLINAVTRRRPEKALRLLSIDRSLAVAAGAVAVVLGAPLVALIALVWVDAVIAAPYRPVQAAMLPALSSTPHELSAFAGSVPTSKALAQAVGALAGSLLLAVTSAQVVMAAAGVVFLVAGVLVGGVGTGALASRPTASAGDGAVSNGGWYGGVTGGFEVVARRAWPLLILGGTRSVTRGLWTALTVVVSLRLLHLGNAGVGLLLAAAGVGAAVAVPLSLHFAGRERLARPAALSFALAGIPIMLVGLTAAALPAIALIALWGAAFALADATSNSLMYRVVEPWRLAPSVAALESSKLLLEGLGALAAPLLLALLGIRATLVVAGAALPALVVLTRGGLLAIDRRAESRARPLAALRRTPSFVGMAMLSLESLAARLRQTTANTGEVIIREGEVGDRFYLIDSGQVEVTIQGFPVALLGRDESFGEKALLRDTKRSATVTAIAPTAMWYLDGADFIASATGIEGPVMQRVERARGHSLDETLAAVPLFAAIDRRDLAAQGEILTVPAGHAVVTEGDPGDRFYVILEGDAHVTAGNRSVGTLQAGDCFGEIALLHSVPRRATVSAVSELKLWSLEREAFLRVLGDSALVSHLAAGRGAETGASAMAGAGLIV